MKNLLVLLLILTVHFFSQSQENYREVGIKTYNFNSVNLLFKKQKKLGKFRRYSAHISSHATIGVSNSSQIGIGGSIGFEKRKELSDKLDFIKGFNPGITFSILTSNGAVSPMVGLSLGYIVGFQYHLNKNFAVGAEMIPTIGLGFGTISNEYLITNTIKLSQSAGIFLIYKFNKE